jgi:hypothetical protein
MKVLIACEESQTVCKAFRAKGHEAYSCDIQDCSGGHPEWHIKGDAIAEAYSGKYDLMVAHPPCTYLSYAGIGWFNVEKYGEKALERIKEKDLAIEFFYKLWRAPIKKICIENPRGFFNQIIKPSQVIHPWYFGDPHKKTTCLWLKGLSKLNGCLEVAMNPGKHEPMPIYIDKSGKKRFFTDAMTGSGGGEKVEGKQDQKLFKESPMQWPNNGILKR